MIKIQRWFLNNRLKNYNYLIVNEATKTAIAVDPYFPQLYLDYLSKNLLKLEAILITHNHHDHVAGVEELLRCYKPIIIGAQAHKEFKLSHIITGDKQLLFTTAVVNVITTPGHVNHHVCYWIKEENACFTGDTLFTAGIGRVLKPGGSIQTFYDSIEKLMNILPLNTGIYSAHDYALENLKFALSLMPNDSNFISANQKLNQYNKCNRPICTMENERKHNIFLRVNEKEVKQALKFSEKINAFCVFEHLRQLKDQF